MWRIVSVFVLTLLPPGGGEEKQQPEAAHLSSESDACSSANDFWPASITTLRDVPPSAYDMNTLQTCTETTCSIYGAEQHYWISCFYPDFYFERFGPAGRALWSATRPTLEPHTPPAPSAPEGRQRLCVTLESPHTHTRTHAHTHTRTPVWPVWRMRESCRCRLVRTHKCLWACSRLVQSAAPAVRSPRWPGWPPLALQEGERVEALTSGQER